MWERLSVNLNATSKPMITTLCSPRSGILPHIRSLIVVRGPDDSAKEGTLALIISSIPSDRLEEFSVSVAPSWLITQLLLQSHRRITKLAVPLWTMEKESVPAQIQWLTTSAWILPALSSVKRFVFWLPTDQAFSSETANGFKSLAQTMSKLKDLCLVEIQSNSDIFASLEHLASQDQENAGLSHVWNLGLINFDLFRGSGQFLGAFNAANPPEPGTLPV